MSDTETVRLTADVVLFSTSEGGQLCVLLIRRSKEPFEGCWALPGGHVDAGEGTEDAARRELAEETSLNMTGLDLVGAYATPGRDPRGRYVTFAYVGTLTSPSTPTAGDDAREARWWPVAELPAMTCDHDQIVADAVRMRGADAELTPLRQQLVTPVEIVNSLGAQWSPDFDAYARGELDLSQVRSAPCAACQSSDCSGFACQGGVR